MRAPPLPFFAPHSCFHAFAFTDMRYDFAALYVVYILICFFSSSAAFQSFRGAFQMFLLSVCAIKMRTRR